MRRAAQPVEGVLLLYHHFVAENAPAIMDHVRSFGRHSRFPTFAVNTDLGFPRVLDRYRFRVIVFHWSLFGGSHYFLNHRYQDLLDRSNDSYKIAFFQDEYRYCLKRFDFLNRFAIDAVFTLLAPEYHEEVYGAHTRVTSIRHTLTGYVSDDLIEHASRLTRPDDERSIDVGYRARRLAYWMGRGAQEKHEIAEHFVRHAADLGLRLDISTRNEDRIYGNSWYEFIASCRGMLGVEAGTSMFDLDDSARERTEAILALEPDLSFEEVYRRVLHEYEGRISHRVMSPRHLEAAAFRVVQIMYRGHYSGVLEPDVHYLALEKDFSNFDDVMTRFNDPEERFKVTERAYADLIESGRYSYSSFVLGFDDHLVRVRVRSEFSSDVCRRVKVALRRGHVARLFVAHPRWFLKNLRFPGRSWVVAAYRTFRPVHAPDSYRSTS